MTSEITTYNSTWPQRYDADKMLLASEFVSAPGLKARPGQ